MHLFFSVGEPSGDLHAARLIRALRQSDPQLRVTGFGGPKMIDAGAKLLFPMTNLALMGILRVIPHLRTFFKLASQAEASFQSERPDALVLVDYPGFNLQLAKRAKKAGLRVIYYLPPQLWAWGSWRLKKIRQWVDHVICSLPFEYEWYRARGVAAELVGHPFFDEVREHTLDAEFMRQSACSANRFTQTVAILPGSRNHEVADNFPLQIEAMNELQRRLPHVRFQVACFNETHRVRCEAMLRDAGSRARVTLAVGKTTEIIEQADVCLFVSGSVSLEVLARHKPGVVLYCVSRFAHTFIRPLIRCRYITLTNLIADRELYPEFAPVGDPSESVRAMVDVLYGWLTNASARGALVDELRTLAESIAVPGATERAAESILRFLSASEAGATGSRVESTRLIPDDRAAA